MKEQRRLESVVKHPRCPFCHEGVPPKEEKRACDACMAWHHEDCWKEHGGCSACGSESHAGQERTPIKVNPTEAGAGSQGEGAMGTGSGEDFISVVVCFAVAFVLSWVGYTVLAQRGGFKGDWRNLFFFLPAAFFVYLGFRKVRELYRYFASLK